MASVLLTSGGEDLAERRMFARSVIGAAKFLRMPASARLLYYDLGMQADDDGIVEAFAVMRTTGAAEDDLRVLVSKGFVIVLNDDLVTYITDWGRNNLIKKDRYHPSVYQSLLVQIQARTQTEPVWNPSGTQTEPEVRLGKDSTGDRADKPPRSRFIPPSIEEVRSFCEEHGYTIDPDVFMDYYRSNGWMVGKTHMKDWKAAARNWHKRAQDSRQKDQGATHAVAKTSAGGFIIDGTELILDADD